MNKNNRRRRLHFIIAVSGLLCGLARVAAADDCDRPAIFWIAGSGDFSDASNFAHGCAPLPTDNVTFGASPWPQSGTVSFLDSAQVNSLLVSGTGWTFSINNNVQATLGFVAYSPLTLEGSGSLVSSMDGGSFSATATMEFASGTLRRLGLRPEDTLLWQETRA